MSGGFQSLVNTVPAPGVAGDFCTANPRYAVIAGPGAMVAGPSGLSVGRFCWVNTQYLDADGGPVQINNFGAGLVAGFVPRLQQGLNSTFLADASMGIPAGAQATAMSSGDFWVVNSGSGQALVGQKAYANFATGLATFAATATAPTATSTSFTIAAGTNSWTASVAGNVMTVTAVGSGTLYPGTLVTGAATGSVIVSQLSGTVGGIGVYALSIGEQTVASGAFTGTYGLLTLGGTITGTFALGMTLSGTGVTASTTITANSANGVSLTGAGGAGTYVVNLTQTASSGTVTGATAVETSWRAVSSAAAGELVKISNLPAAG